VVGRLRHDFNGDKLFLEVFQKEVN